MAPIHVDFEGRWRALSEEVIIGIKAWRLQHPKATLEAIEAAVDERLARFRARMLQDVALASQAADLSQSTVQERPVCPSCGGPVEPRGLRERHLTTHQGHMLTLERSDAVCPTCQVGFFPPG
jgi:hypothetical protein